MILLLIALTLGLFVYSVFKLTFWKRQHLPNILSLNFKHICGQSYSSVNTFDKKFGKIVGTYEYWSPVLIVAEPNLINYVLVDNTGNFSQRKPCIKSKNPMGSSIFNGRSDESLNVQNILTKVFTTKNFMEMTKHFAKSNYELIDLINKVSEIEKSIDLKMFLSMYITKSYLGCCFGSAIDRKIRAKLLDCYQNLLNTKSASLRQRISNMGSVEAKQLNIISGIVEKIYDNRKENECKNSLLFMLKDSDHEKCLTKKQIIDNCLMFSIIGYKTSLMTISYLIYNLAINQPIQQKVIKEVDQFLNDIKPKNNGKDKNTEKTENKSREEIEKESENFLSKLNGLDYLNACIKETLRLYPPVSTIKRKVNRNHKYENIFIPKSSQILIPIYRVHRDEDNYSDPNSFKPDRFLSKNIHKIPAGSYLPFGDGPRKCAGISVALLEIKLSIISLLKTFRFAKCSQTKELEYKPNDDFLCTASPSSVFLKIIKRSKGLLD